MLLPPIRVAAFLVCLAFGCILLFIVSSLHGVDSQRFRKNRPNYPPHSGSWQYPTENENEKIDPASRLLWASRASSIREAFLHAYSGYIKYAPFPADELRPLSNTSTNNFNGWGVTMVDSLDVMLLMGLHDEFRYAISKVSTLDFTMPTGEKVPFFETVIRYLGGFLSAYALSNETIFLSLAERLATKLLPTFKTDSGLPAHSVDFRTNHELVFQRGQISPESTIAIAELGSYQMEFKYLSHLTGRNEFFRVAERPMDILAKTQSTSNHLWPSMFSVNSGSPSSGEYTIGAPADSAYEYLLKQYLLSNKTETKLAELYMSSMSGVIDNLLYLSPTRRLLYATSVNIRGDPTGKFEHLSCFLPGLLALGASTLPDSVMSPDQRKLHMWAAEGLGHTCWLMYAERPSGLGPENVWFEQWSLQERDLQGKEDKNALISQAKQRGRWMAHVAEWEKSERSGGKPPGTNDPTVMVGAEKKVLDYYVGHDSYLLRPESLFILYRITKDPKWRDRGWQLWDSIAKKTRTSSGFATALSLNFKNPTLDDSMPSYFLAETIKYAYLSTLDYDPIPMSSFVLNTEAHPLPIFDWRDWESNAHHIKS
ncbi:hypothetical protein Clacol_006265 [Clathrus columnatus]|uniref:alpha-1,2-Mannosidase n=1 Tax=Clathrus columnatus TaxID=1419009 RepID=A0AAV5AJ90_9AGAM|nr:hypothetical protein Clacol_006265 [Clathrus columnatus]